ncbi:hypothetical protein VTK56DRAFT_3249 [Thermocarpiscus australiensis]
MGLPLYEPPVESDVQAKHASENGPAQSRSTIRRTRLTRSPDQIRERRRRILAASSSYRREPPAFSSATSGSNGASSGPEEHLRAVRNLSRRSAVDDRIVTIFGDPWASVDPEPNMYRLRRDDDEPWSMQTMAVGSEFLPRSRPEPPYAVSSIRSTQAPNNPSRSATRSPADSSSARRPRAGRATLDLADELRPSLDGVAGFRRSVRERAARSRRNEQPPVLESNRLDGLGDRDRSLSPEGDNVWDTLLSTVTPDPQPPSVGSSFASASASAAASQSAGAASSRTSFTAGDTPEESAVEPACESGCDNSDTEGDDDDDDEEEEMDELQLPRFSAAALGGGRRSYADAVRSNNEEPLELLGGIGGLQRIVRNLARREDIPDEWWAEVGLSRTLSREASGN